ncbi:MAG: glycosyltransferase family A protein, partial [Gammaproteobacteria bacterium]
MSVIVPVHNRPVLLREAVASAMAQTYRPIEIIIIDDGSTDTTPAAIADLAERHAPVLRAVRQDNAGPGRAREAGRLLAQGEFIQYLDSDDLLLPTKFELQVAGLRALPGCGAAYGKTRLWKEDRAAVDELPVKRTGEAIATMFPAFLQSRWW